MEGIQMWHPLYTYACTLYNAHTYVVCTKKKKMATQAKLYSKACLRPFLIVLSVSVRGKVSKESACKHYTVYTTCTLQVHHMYTICTPHAHYIYTICTLYVHQIYTICTLYVHHMHTTCTTHVHHMHTTCTTHVQHMNNTCTPNLHHIYNTCTLQYI